MKRNSLKLQNKISGILFFLFSVIWLVPVISSFEFMRRFGDSLAADGNLELFTPERFHILRILFAVASAANFGLCLWAFFFPAGFDTFFRNQLQSFRSLPGRYVHDFNRFRKSVSNLFHLEKIEFIYLLIILITGLAVRLIMINRPMTHDESYSVFIWGSSSLRHTTNDYHLPNNHIFHSILVNLIYHTLGKTPALVRLPALISGWLMIPFAFLLGKKLYNRDTGLLTAGLTAFAPFLIDYSTSARGYTLFSLITIQIFLLGFYVLKQKNLFGWLIIILLSAIGFYTLPVMLYPFGTLCIWFFINMVFKQTSGEYPGRLNFLKYLLFCGIAVSVLSLLLYTPVFINSGTASLFNNVFVQPLPKNDFVPTLLSRFTDNFHAFTDTVPSYVWIALFLGNLIILCFHRSNSSARIPLQLAFLLWLPPVILYQRPNLWPRTQIYLWVPIIMWGAAGIIFAISQISKKFLPDRENFIVRLLISILILTTAIPQFRTAISISKVVSNHESAIRRIMQDSLEGVLIVVAPEDDASMWYYADRYDLPKSLFDRNRPFSTVYVYANPINEGFEEPRTIDDVINRYGPGAAFILQDTKQILMEKEDVILCKFNANIRVIEETFGSTE
ncbi:MAG: glycosyltransferase family 39 protein [Flexilinea sp.]